LACRFAIRRGPQRGEGAVTPGPALEAADGGNDLNPARAQAPPGSQQTKAVVEIDVAADVKDGPHVGQLGGVVDPSAAMQERDAAHPVGVVVEYQQIEWVANAAE